MNPGTKISYKGGVNELPLKKGSVGLVQRVMFKNAVGALFTAIDGRRIIAYLNPNEYKVVRN